MKVPRHLLAIGVGLAMLCGSAIPTWAGNSSQEGAAAKTAAEGNFLLMQEYHITNAQLPGTNSTRQTVTAWQVSQGSWNGQVLDGLSLVLVRSQADDGRTAPTTNCYVSHIATAAQRQALVGAFLTTQGATTPEPGNMRVEPAVIRFEIDGQTVILHLGLVA